MIRYTRFDSNHTNNNYSSVRYQGAQQLGQSASVMIVFYVWSHHSSLY